MESDKLTWGLDEGFFTLSELCERVDREQRQAIERIELLKESKLKWLELGKILYVHNSWVVTEYGVECLEVYYPIQKERLWEGDWVRHMLEKYWVNMRDFCEALYRGREIHTTHKPSRN